MVKISVILPIYNSEKYLKQCLDSIVNQTFKDIEIICINDGSTDNSLNILKDYQKNDSRLIIITQENKGLGAARNVGLENVSGEYVYFIDSDDFLELNAFERLSSAYFDKNFDIVMFKLNNFFEETGKILNDDYYNMPYLKERVGTNPFNYEDISHFALKLCVCAPGNLFNYELIKNIRFPEGLMYEDNVFFTNAFFKAKTVYFYDEYLYNRRKHKNSLTDNKTVEYLQSIEISNQILDLCDEFHHEEQKREVYFRIFNMTYRKFKTLDSSQKELYFQKLKHEYTKNLNRWQKDDYFNNKLRPKYRHRLNCALKAENAKKFESCVDNYKKQSIFKRLRKKLYEIIKIKN